MHRIASTPPPPYYFVIFTSRNVKELDENQEYQKNYETTLSELLELAEKQPGFLGIEIARSQISIACTYWKDLESIESWKNNAKHVLAQEKARKFWLSEFVMRIGRVEREDGAKARPKGS